MSNKNHYHLLSSSIEENEKEQKKDAQNWQLELKDILLPASIFLAALLIAGAWIYSATVGGGLNRLPSLTGGPSSLPGGGALDDRRLAELESKVLPAEGIVLPVKWGDLGKKLIQAGVLDKEKLESLYAQRGGLTAEEKNLIERTDNGYLKITLENSGFILNLLWALGLGNQNQLLDSGLMVSYDGKQPASRAEILQKAANFASTGGWTLALGETMDHYSKYPLVVLTPDEQRLVERVAQNIYRPCCDNPTSFPDCNHGMAMLALLQLMAAQGVSEEEMYRTALQVNAYWFPDVYLSIAQYFADKGIEWSDVNPKEVLGFEYSSASGYNKILSQIKPLPSRGGGGCGV